MNAEELYSRLKRYGADVDGIEDRFMGDANLYEMCLADFLGDANFVKLTDTIDRAEYSAAFDAAHALKGLSGNLGLTPFYEDICTLVESLRAKEFTNVRNQYANVMNSLRDVADTFGDVPNLGAPLPEAENGGAGEVAPDERPEFKAEPPYDDYATEFDVEATYEKYASEYETKPTSDKPAPEAEPTSEEPAESEKPYPSAKSWEQQDDSAFAAFEYPETPTPLEPEEKSGNGACAESDESPGNGETPDTSQTPESGAEEKISQPPENDENRDTAKSDETAATREPPSASPENPPDAGEPFYKVFFKKIINRLNEKGPNVLMIGATLALIVIFVIMLFANLINNYNSTNAASSADHLEEICFQLKLYVEENMRNNWMVAESIASAIGRSNFYSNDDELFEFVREQRDIWDVDDIIVYTTDGLGLNSDKAATPNDVVSQTIYTAQTEGEYMTILNTELIYTLPVRTGETLSGSRIAAISVCHEVATFLDDMNFESFDGKAFIYLVQNTGAVISSLTNENTIGGYNMGMVLENMALRTLAGKRATAKELFDSTSIEVFMVSDKKGASYVVSSPINVHDSDITLLYVVSENLVNEASRKFSNFITLLSAVLISIVLAGVLFIFVNVYNSSKRRFDEELISREHMYELLARSAQAAFGFYRDGNAKPAYVTKNVKSIIGREAFMLKNRDGRYYMENPDGTGGADLNAINDAIRDWDGKSPFTSGYVKNEFSRVPSYFEMQLSGAYDGHEEIVCVVQNATDAFVRERTLKEALSMAESANRAKSRFLSNMSHDIRTPMNAIVNMTSFAVDNIDNPAKLNEYLSTIRKSSDHLLNLINDVLAMSRIESGKNSIAEEPFDMMELANRLSDIVLPLCKSKNLTLITDFSQLGYKDVVGDHVKLSQILMNLLSNAVKYTPNNGAVRFSVCGADSIREDIESFTFTVEDNGIGIPQDYLDKIFEPFSRVDSRRTSGIEGSGLGLSICHSYVVAMGGTLSCESEEGNGSTFTVELLFKKGDETAAKERVSETPAYIRNDMPFLGKHCLVCEDNHTNLLIAKTMLEKLGFLVSGANDGWEAVNMFRTSKPGQFDIIYMDIQMPVMDGYEATVAIRESDHKQAKTIPIIAMTANVFAEDVEKARIAGMNGHVGKPIFTIDLVRETDRALNKTKEASE